MNYGAAIAIFDPSTRPLLVQASLGLGELGILILADSHGRLLPALGLAPQRCPTFLLSWPYLAQIFAHQSSASLG